MFKSVRVLTISFEQALTMTHALEWRKFKHRYHLGLSGVGARDIYLWVQKRFVLAKQLIHFKPSLLVHLSDN